MLRHVLTNDARGFCAAILALLAPWTLPANAAAEWALVEEGRSTAAIYAPGASEWAGRRLADRIHLWTGATLPVRTDSALPTENIVVAVGMPGDNQLVRETLGDEPRLRGLGEEGYLLKGFQRGDRRVILATGAALPGVNNAVSELVTWRLRVLGKSALVPDELDVVDQPALKYRLLWNWTMATRWDETVPEMYSPDPQNANNSPAFAQGAKGYVTHFKRAIDFFSDHKLNGLVLWHMLNDRHGGIESAREIITHGQRQNVRILPGIGTVVYNGFYSSGRSPYSLPQWMQEHPEIRRAVDAQGKPRELPCSSDPLHKQWLSDGTRWLFSTFPGLGGANVEHGDFHACECELCKAQRARPENDPNCFWDMMVTEKPVLATAAEVSPDAWMIFATYCGFTGSAVQGSVKGAIFPPRFLKQVPSNAICQWTLTNMITPASWPEGARPPKGSYRHNIGYLHQGGIRNCCPGHPVDRARWWAGPSAMGDDISEVIQFVCGRLKQAEMDGLCIYGEVGAAVPASELKYVAMEYFTWHPERSWDDLVRDRLSVCYGDVERAALFLRLLRDTTRDSSRIEADHQRALALSRSEALEVRQQQRWRNLSDELARRSELLAHPTTVPAP